MKKSIKYITLVFGSIAFAFFFLLATSLLLDIKSLEHPASLILPEVMFVLLLTTLIFLIIWGFKFSNNKPHKVYLIFMSICLSLTVLFFILSKVINPIITSVNTTSELPTNYINVNTFAEDLKYLTSSNGYDILDMPEVESSDGLTNSKSITLKNSSTDLFHITMTYNKKTQGLISVSMFRNKDASIREFGDMILAIVISIDSDIDYHDFIAKTYNAALGDTPILTEFELFEYFYNVNDSFRNVYLTIN